jgi:CYTH domain-containing protein
VLCARISVLAAVGGSVASVHKYAVVERECRFLVAEVPGGVVEIRQIVDHYLDGTRLRLREVIDTDGRVTRKLGHKVRLTAGPSEVACTSLYLDDREWELLRALPSRTLRKTRYIIERDGIRLAVDELDDGTLVAEIDDGDAPPRALRTG